MEGVKCADDIVDAVKALDNTKDVTKAADDIAGAAKYLDDVIEGGTGNDIGYMKNNSDAMRDVLGSGRNSNPEEWISFVWKANV